MGANTSKWAVLNSVMGGSAGWGINAGAGINISAGSDNYRIVGNDLTDNTFATVLGHTAGAHKVVKSNIGFADA